MRGTIAVMDAQLGYAGDATERPLCPACDNGRLHPYVVTFEFPLLVDGLHYTAQTVDYLEGWVAVCTGNAAYNRAMRDRYEKSGAQMEPGEQEDEVPPCGFTMALTPKTHFWRKHNEQS